MGFYTELFSRPRPREDAGMRASIAVLNAVGNAARLDGAVRPADFPRLARDLGPR